MFQLTVHCVVLFFYLSPSLFHSFSHIFLYLYFPTRLRVYCTANIGAPGKPLSSKNARKLPRKLARKNVRLTLEQNVPATLEKNVPPNVGKNVPPTVGKNVPPTVGKNVPPTLGKTFPPTLGEIVPQTPSAPKAQPLKSSEQKAIPVAQEISKSKRKRMRKSAAKIRDEQQQAVPL
jgi:hypothetical protein